ncbi:MAG TPA: patatin-like phospholipase family protein [Acidimicrobiales bacterium]
MTDSIALSDASCGYERDPALQVEFLDAAERLRVVDGWPNPANAKRLELRADLVLEGGGVKGLGLVGAILVLHEAGYSFRAVAGTSAGAIAATLVAGLSRTERPMTDLLGFIRSLDFTQFMPESKLQKLLGHAGGEVIEAASDASILLRHEGVYSGDYLETWLRPIMHDQLGVRTFNDLKFSLDDDPELSVAPGHDYSLVVHTSDITRGQLVRLPWDFAFYGKDPDIQDPVDTVRASMSIPFFFEPYHHVSQEATVEIAVPGGDTITLRYEAGSQTWVDGGLLANFPIHAFNRTDGKPSRWPTIGIKLSQLQTSFPATEACSSTWEVAMRTLKTMSNEWDSYAVNELTAAKTIFVDNAGLAATDFNLTKVQQDTLFLNGVRSATEFVISKAQAGGVPRSSA